MSNPGEDCWRRPETSSIGDNALGHIVTHKGPSSVPLWVWRERDTKPGPHTPCLGP